MTTSSHTKLSWLTIVLGLLTLITFFAVSGPLRYVMPLWSGMSFNNYSGMTGGAPKAGVAVPESAGAPSMYYPPHPPPQNCESVTDTREFLMRSYNAQLSTRDVSGTTRRVETTVRGHGGRVDNESTNTEYGYVSFAIPQSKFDEFRDEIESMVGSRFITITTSAQNLLGEKRSIEDQQAQASSTLAGYTASRAKLVAAHSTKVKSLQSQIASNQKEIDYIHSQPPTEESSAQAQVAANTITQLQNQLAQENLSYANELSAIDGNIAYTQKWQQAVDSSDQALMDQVATVTGTISVRFISLWEIAQLYLPGYWIPGIFLVLTILSYLRDRRRSRVTGQPLV